MVLAEGRSQGAEVELLFLQQCGKGTLENYYSFKDAAKVVMGSQTNVGAPNSYYAASVRWAGRCLRRSRPARCRKR